MRIVFMGTPEFAATILDDLAQQHDVVAVYTRPDAIRGRGKRLEPSPVKRVAQHYEIPVQTPQTLRNAEVLAELSAYEPDVICVAAYGAILPKDVLDIPRFGCLNVHASLLPRWRGAAPIERAILAGDEETGVCVMRMEEGLDTGAYCVCRTASIDGKSAQDLTDELANLGSHALLTALVRVECGADVWTEQVEADATYASKIEKHELDLRPNDSVETIVRKVQASSEQHPARAVIAGRGLTVLAVSALNDDQARQVSVDMTSGEVRFIAKRLFLGAIDGAVEIKQVKPDGKQAMDAKAFAAGIQGIKQGGLTWGDCSGNGE